MITFNKQIINYIVLALAVTALIFYWAYYYPAHKDNKEVIVNTKVRSLDMNVSNQKKIIEALAKRQDLQGKLMYDIENFAYADNHTYSEHRDVLNKYMRMYASSTSKIVDKYNRDMAIYGWLYIFNKTHISPTTTMSDKVINKQVNDKIKSMIKVSNEVTSPEVLNDKVFLASRLKLTSNYIISFISYLSKDEIKSYQKMIMSDIDAMNRTNMSMFNTSNSKFTLMPLRSEMLAQIALYQSGVLDGNAHDKIYGVYTKYQNFKTDDISSYNATGMYMNMYYLYYLNHIIDTKIATSTEIKMAEANLIKFINVSAYNVAEAKSLSEYLQTPQGKWEVVKMAIVDVVK